MNIPDKYRDVIITSLKYSIFHIREYHQKIQSDWPYDYENQSIKPIEEALGAVRNTIKKPIK